MAAESGDSGDKNPTPASLDALLSANRDQFESLFQRQMSAAPPPVVPARGARRDKPTNQPVATGKHDVSDAIGTTDARPDTVDPRHGGPDQSRPVQPVSKRPNIRAELNRRFTITWSSETLESQIQNGRAIVRCKLNVGDDSRTESGTSRVGDDGNEAAAVQRALDNALKKCADHFTPGPATSVGGAAPVDPLPSAALGQRAEQQAGPLDVVTMDRIETALDNARREMQTVAQYRALSVLRDHHCEPAMITDAHGQMINGQTGSYVGHLLNEQALQLAPGDVLLQSDPYLSGGAVSHLNDWMVLAPVFFESALVGFVSMIGHMADAGGSAAGSMPAAATSIFGEGMRIAPIRIIEAGVLNDSALQLILNNSRTQEANRANLMALIAGCQAGAAQVAILCDRFGPQVVEEACTMLRERSRRHMRDLIAEHLPEEPQSFEDQIDDDGLGNGPFKLKLTVWREADHAYIDWTGTSAQAAGPVNFYLHVGLAKMFAGMCLASGSDPALLCNDGYYDLIHVTVPAGSLLRPCFPAPLGHRDHTLARHLEVLANALNRHKPARLSGAGYGAVPSFRYVGLGQNGQPFELRETLVGGLAGRPDHDGQDGRSLWPGAQNIPAEHVENNFPIVVESCASIADTGGAGLYRGGNGIEKVYRMLAAGRVSIHDDRHVSAPWGIHGGQPGAVSEKWIVRADGSRDALPAKLDDLAVVPGDRIVLRTAGGGGCGDPLERDPSRVQHDVRRGLLSVDGAANYGVVLAGTDSQVDMHATRELRDTVRRERNPLALFDVGDPAVGR